VGVSRGTVVGTDKIVKKMDMQALLYWAGKE
jgi:hypothetical protein